MPAYAAVDWGTSSFRLWLMDENNRVLAEKRSNEGMAVASSKGFRTVLETHLQAVDASADLRVIVCGMAGARQGWVEAGYVEVPAPLASILAGTVQVPGVDRDIRILPGLCQRAPLAADVMRGEETQLLGALKADIDGDQIICMPGTHSKWVVASDNTVTGFSTYMTGELYDVISKHSVLSHSLVGAETFDGDRPAFTEAVRATVSNPQNATGQLFSVRSGMLLEGLAPTDAAARLSGMLIGLEIAGGLPRPIDRTTIQLVASGRLDQLYRGAFTALSLPFQEIDADEAVRRGLAIAAHKFLLSAR